MTSKIWVNLEQDDPYYISKQLKKGYNIHASFKRFEDEMKEISTLKVSDL